MPIIAIAVIGLVSLVLDLLMFLMFARALVSWLPDVSESRIGEFLYTVTEWVIMPVRSLMSKLGINPMLPIDLPFFATFLLLSLVSAIL